MSLFTYTALDKANAYQRGNLQARSARVAAATLERQGLSVITIRQEKKKTWLDAELTSGLGLQEKILITRHLHTMLEAGIALDESLKTIAEQSTSTKVRTVLIDLQQRVQKGQPFHVALAQHPKYFSALYVSLVKVGETSGKLDEVLAYLLVQQEKDLSLRTKVFNAMLYPTIILTALLLMVSLMLVFVIPRVKSVLEAYDVGLPLQTRILIAVSNVLTDWWFVIFPGLVLLFLLFRKLKSQPRGKRWWDNFILGLPGIGLIVREVNLARLMRTLASTLKSGLSIDKSLELGTTVATHTKYQESVSRAANLVRRGVGLGEILQGYPKIYPPMSTRMISIGEKTGKLDHMLERLATFYEGNVETKLNNLSSIIEPLLILVIGLVVGYVAISVMTPIWSFSQTI